jgi:hypothetical protein
MSDFERGGLDDEIAESMTGGLFDDSPLFDDDPLFGDEPMFDDSPLFDESPLFEDAPLFDSRSPFDGPPADRAASPREPSGAVGPRDRGPGGRWRPATSSR